MEFAPLSESSIRTMKGKSEAETFGTLDKILSSTNDGGLAIWNQPIKVRVKMQSSRKDKVITVKLTIRDTLTGIYAKDAMKVFIVVLLLVLD
jgi:hypothetical protein